MNPPRRGRGDAELRGALKVTMEWVVARVLATVFCDTNDEADVHQLRNVISETKEIVHLYLEVLEGRVEQTEVVDKIVPYNVENIVSDNVEECPQEETVALNTVEEENLYEFGRLCDKTDGFWS
ncbi:unnamed protein product [Lactuca saligna]|uniref:Uncharacterized protein n=1 Tax=Lactuca saligna TaxID=75948 RepID=A0AA36EDW8_LACSI|nr:unnamed protein product [Lactuca saligna]